jgi:hypothetical protein
MRGYFDHHATAVILLSTSIFLQNFCTIVMLPATTSITLHARSNKEMTGRTIIGLPLALALSIALALARVLADVIMLIFRNYHRYQF